MDLNKEIKLSDLFKRPKNTKKPKPAVLTTTAAVKKRPKKKQEFVGLKIGASQLAAARVVNNGGRPKLVQVARGDLEPGVVARGEVRDVAALAGALADFFAANNLPRRGIRLGIGTNRIGVRSIDVQGIEDERQLANAVRFRAQEALAIPLDEAVLDFQVTKETVDEQGAVTRRVLLAAAYKDLVDQYVAACQQAHLELVGIDVEAFALLRAVAPDQGRLPVGDEEEMPSSAAVVAVSIGHDRSTLAISDGAVCDFMRVLEWGGANLDAAIARVLGLTHEEAGEVKLSVDLTSAEDGDARASRARQAVLQELHVLAREIVASLQFSPGEPGSLPIREIVCTGGTTRMPGLVEELERQIRARVRAADPLERVHAADGVSGRDDLPSLTIAIGLGVDS